MMAQLISRAGQARRAQQEKEEIHERWVASDAQRRALMGVSKALAQQLDKRVLFTSIMTKARELTEVDRATLFLISPQKHALFTHMPDGAHPLTMEIGKGLAGALTPNPHPSPEP